MTSGSSTGDNRDHDALGWAGDDDPTLLPGGETGQAEQDAAPADTVAPAETVAPADAVHPFDAVHPAVPEGWTVAGPASAVEAAAANKAPATMSSFALIALGVFGGVYLLYTVGWFIGVQRIQNPLSDVLGQFMFSLGLWLAVAAPAAWFAVTFWLTGARPRARIGWLFLGVVLLAPLPFIVGTGALA
jgi:hypothetical protein